MSTPMSMNTNHQMQSTPIVIGPPPGINNIYVRPKRPQQIFQPTHQNLNTINSMMSISNNITNSITNSISNNINNNIGNSIVNSIANNNLTVNNLNNQQIVATQPPRMRHQQNNQRPPPGSVNLERSYQICQAVIQNSTNPNRQQLNNQLKPPPPHVMSQKKF